MAPVLSPRGLCAGDVATLLYFSTGQFGTARSHETLFEMSLMPMVSARLMAWNESDTRGIRMDEVVCARHLFPRFPTLVASGATLASKWAYAQFCV